MNSSLVISMAALLFAVTSFWWIQVRRGRLRSYRPYSFAGYFAHGDVLISLPVVFHNTGAAPIVILDLRLQVGDEYLPWSSIQRALDPATENLPIIHPTPIPVAGRSTLERFVQFGLSPLDLDVTAGPLRTTLEARLAHRASWQTLVSFPLHTELIEGNRGQYIVHSNDPERRS